jgi:hypothetical protein
MWHAAMEPITTAHAITFMTREIIIHLQIKGKTPRNCGQERERGVSKRPVRSRRRAQRHQGHTACRVHKATHLLAQQRITIWPGNPEA